MSRMERVLADDLARLIDRLAASIPEGAFERVCTTTPTLRARLDQQNPGPGILGRAVPAGADFRV